MKKTGIILPVIALAGILVASGCRRGDAEGAIRIGVAVPTASHGWTGGIGWWAAHTVEELRRENPHILFNVVHSANATQQVTDLENLAAWRMDYLVILPHESAPLTPPVRELASSGVKVIVVDRGLTDTGFGHVNIAGDNPGMGRVSGQWLARTMVEEGLTRYVAMGGLPIVIDAERMETFFEEMNREPSLVNLLGGNRYEFANFSPQDGMRLMETFLQQYPRIDAVFCQDDDVLIGVLQAIRESGRSDIRIAMGGAGSRAVYEMIMSGDPLVRATSLYHPMMISDGIRYAVDAANGVRSADFAAAGRATTVVIPSLLIDRNNVAQFYNPDSSF